MIEKKRSYPGSKAANGAWQKIISEIPRCEIFVEAMAGSAVISEKLKGLCSIVINDLDGSVTEKIQPAPGLTIENQDYQCIIDRYDCEVPRTVFYFDPPYLMETRSHKKRLYKFDWADVDHYRFLRAVRRVKSPCLISHYPCELYDFVLRNWRKILYQSMTRGGVRTECLYMNFPQPALLANYKFIGENFTDRQRVQRKIARLIARLNKETGQERAAILSSIIDYYSYVRS